MGYLQDLTNEIEGMRSHPRHYNIKMQAHHVLSKSGLNNSRLKTKLRLAGYDIDTVKNLVFIPCTLQGACHLVSQLHRGNHPDIDPEGDREDADDEDTRHPKRYHDLVASLIREEFKNVNICKLTANQVKAKMNKLSKNLLEKIDNFSVALTKIALTFKARKKGCRGADTVDQANKNKDKPCPVKRRHAKNKSRSQRKENISYTKRKRRYILKVGK